MADARLRVLLDEAGIAARVELLADKLSEVDDGWTVVALLQGAIPFAADLMRAIEKRGKHPIYDSLWLESYRDERESSGKVVVRADISRSVEGRPALIVDDVFDSGRTIAYARAHLMAKGATRTLACAFVRKPLAMGSRSMRSAGTRQAISWSATAWTMQAAIAACRLLRRSIKAGARSSD
ncbi:MAG: phosphoribosyltransferase [Hyphomonadaceae bacterium JAD_PAG50586_4]|nr:MAG: phosphoribosyltransferase [Hyphomonadaceae bacterium JAD_PAG50586_4]